MGLRSFQELIDSYPNLGPAGCREEARQQEVDPALVPLLAQVASEYCPSLSQALEYWTKNNDSMMRFMMDRVRDGEANARENVFFAHLEKLWGSSSDYRLSIGLLPAHASASNRADTVARHIDRILSGFTSPLFSDRSISIHRGTSVYLDELEAEWGAGRTVTTDAPLACTLNGDVVPLHFAWKRRNKLATRCPGRPIASVLLEIKPDPERTCPLLWAGFFQQTLAGADYRWQQEVLTPPRLNLTIESCEPVPGLHGGLYRVTALGSVNQMS